MGMIRRTGGRLRRESGGFTLIEMLVASTLGLVVVGGALTIFISAVKSQPRAGSQAAGVQQARSAMERMTRELRQGVSVSTASPSQVAVTTFVPNSTCGGAASTTSILCRVTYSCAAGTCTRTVAQPNGSAPGPAVRVVSGLSSTSVFTYAPSAAGSSCGASVGTPTYVCVRLALPSNSGGNAVTLNDAVALRNT
jgi:prepilin-type N-terminal cleavage/methylation domain-containing protein